MKMNEKPILFSGAMVRAIMAGKKTQTRRVMRPQPEFNDKFWRYKYAFWSSGITRVPVAPAHSLYNASPYGGPGDSLWVRETWYPHGFYRATFDGDFHAKWRPSIFMPRWASRLDLSVLEVRVERLQSISREDARAEGVSNVWDWKGEEDTRPFEYGALNPYVANFAVLWDSINAKPRPRYETINGRRVISHYESFPWADVREARTYRGKPWRVIGNPWVWVVRFSLAGEKEPA